MGVPGSAAALLFGQSQEEAAAYEVSNSLRLDSDNSAHLRKRFSRNGNRRTFTFSCWVKIGKITNTQRILFSASSSSAGYFSCDLRDNRARILQWNGSNAITSQLHTEKRLTDPAAWYHLVFSVDTTASSSDRYRIFVNGERQTSFVTEAQPQADEELYVNVADNPEDYPATHQIGNNASSTYNAYFDGLIAECRFIDGQALNASDLGEPDSTSGRWNPKDYTHTSVFGQGGWEADCNGTPYNASKAIKNTFDGSTTSTSAATGGTSITFTPSTAITGITAVKITAQRDSSHDGSLLLNGTNIVNNWSQGTTSTQTISTNNLTSLAWSTDSDNQWIAVAKIQVVKGGVDYTLVPGSTNDFYLKFDPSVSGVTYTDGDNNTVDSNGVVNSFIVDAVGNTTFAYHSSEYGTDKIFGKGPQGIYTSYPSNSVSEYKIDLNALGSFGTISKIRLLIRYASGSQYSPWNVSILDANKSVIGGPHVVASGALSWQDFSYSGTPRYIKLDDGDGASSKRCVLGGIEINGVVLIDHTFVGADSSGRGNDWYQESINDSVTTFPQTSVANATGALPILNTSGTYGDALVSGVRSDSLASSLQFCIPCGTSSARDFTDRSPSGRTSGSRNVSGNPGAHSTSHSQFYGGSLYMSGGTSGSFSTDAWTAISSASGQFTIEFWVKLVSTSMSNGYGSTILSSRAAGDNGAGWIDVGWQGIAGNKAALRLQISQGWNFYFNLDGSNNAVAFPTDTWYHIALSRDGNNDIRLFANGVLLQTQNNSVGITTISRGLFGGHAYGAYASDQNYYLQDIRFYSTAKYTSSFTPPYPETVVLNPENLDSLIDSPTDFQSQSGLNRGTYAALSLVDNAGLPITQGGFACGTSSGWQSFKSTIGVSSGKFYWESQNRQDANAILGVAMLEASVRPSGSIFGSTGHGGGDSNPAWTWAGQYDYFNGTSTYTGHANHSASDIVMYALDLDNGKLWFGRNGTWYGSSWSANGNPATGANPTVENLPAGTYFPAGTVHQGGAFYNFGQRGSFSYSAPTGFLSLCTTNLPDSPITDGSTAMDAKTYVGNGGSQSITGLNFGTAPSLVWIKNRSHYTNEGHALFDILRGKQVLSPSEAQPESNWHGANGMPYRGYVDSFDTNGFSLVPNAASSLTDYVNYNNATYVAWVWSAGNGNRTYTVKVVNDGGNKYRLDGCPNNGVTLDLAEGSTYIFDQSDSSNTGHPIRFGTSANGTGYTTGVTHTGTPGSAGAKTTLVLASGAPTIYYSCQHHSGMGGQINTNSTGGSTSLIGSLNSVTYNTSQTWSSSNNTSGDVRTSGSYTPAAMFNGVIGNENTTNAICFSEYASNSSMTWTSPVTLNNIGKLRLWTDKSGTGTGFLRVNGNNYDSLVTDGWITIPETSLSTIQFGYTGGLNTASGVGAVELDGVLLIDSNASPPNVPVINATVKANPEYGFSVINYTTSNADSASDAVLSHGLNKAPEMVFFKPIDEAQGWTVYHKDIPDPLNSYLYLETTNATVAPGIETFIVNQYKLGCRGSRLVAGNSQDIAVFAWTSIPGFSAFGKYVGGGGNYNPFIWTGFSPRWLLIKNISNGSYRHWVIIDTARSTINQEGEEPVLFADVGVRESYADNNHGQFGSKDAVDFASNGFTVVEQDTNNVYTQINRPGDTHVWAAFAENPFKLSRGQ